MIQIRRAGTAEFAAVREFYYAVIDEMKDAEFKPDGNRMYTRRRTFCGRRWTGASSTPAK